MSISSSKQRLIKWVRRYPLIALSVLATGYLLGGFSKNDDGVLPQQVVITGLYLFVGVVPLGFIIAFVIIGSLSDAQSIKNKQKSNNLNYQDAFNLPSEVMHGYKLALLTDPLPTLTGLTGDKYLSDANAICTTNPAHTPPVAECECGFLLEVDLFGLGFTYKDGFRAETQVVNHLIKPKRCMRCKTLPAKVFVCTYKLTPTDSALWQWQIRCVICSSSFKEEDKLSTEQMAHHLRLKII